MPVFHILLHYRNIDSYIHKILAMRAIINAQAFK